MEPSDDRPAYRAQNRSLECSNTGMETHLCEEQECEVNFKLIRERETF